MKIVMWRLLFGYFFIYYVKLRKDGEENLDDEMKENLYFWKKLSSNFDEEVVEFWSEIRLGQSAILIWSWA
jgi:hypothetical protein